MPVHDAVVVGLGAMGTAAAEALARRGRSVLALERFEPGHANGSSHGESRFIRRTYSEGEVYRPLLEAAFDAWAAAERRAGRRFFHAVGGLDISRGDDTIFDDALRSAESAGVRHEVYEDAAFFDRFPAFGFDGPVRAVFAPGSGFLECDAALAWLRRSAQDAGAELRGRRTVRGWRVDGDAVTVTTDAGDHRARKLILAAGPWTSRLLPALAGRLDVERQVVGYFSPADPILFRPDRLPIFQIGHAGARWYGSPAFSAVGVKFAKFHHAGERGPAMIDGRPPDADDEALIRAGLRAVLPAADGPPLAMESCRFTLAPGGRLRFGPWPDQPRVIVVAACSGHGFKFAPAIGDILADMVEDRRPAVDVAPFAW